MRQSKRAFYQKYLADERAWMQICGGDLAGYVRNYHLGHGRTLASAEAIYRADLAKVRELEAKLQALR